MKRIASVLCALLFLLGSPRAEAQFLSQWHGFVHSTAAPAYAGPGNIVSGAQAWYSCGWAYNAAYATGANYGCQLERISDNATQNVALMSNGFWDYLTAAHFCFNTTCKVKEAYDQTGNGCPAIQNGTGSQPTMVLTGGTSAVVPYISFLGSSSLYMATAASCIPSITDPISFSAVVNRTAAFTSAGGIISIPTNIRMESYTSANTAGLIAPGVMTAAATDSAWHAITGQIASVSGGSITVDGSTTPTSATLVTASTVGILTLGRVSTAGAPYFTGALSEAGVWPSAITTQLNANQHARGGF